MIQVFTMSFIAIRDFPGIGALMRKAFPYFIQANFVFIFQLYYRRTDKEIKYTITNSSKSIFIRI